MSESYKIPKPEGWEKPWPFADEVRLWDIPATEAPAALQWEMFRHKLREPHSTIGENKPWLLLDREARKAVERLLRKTALFIPDSGAIERAKSKGIKVDIDPGNPECGQMELAIYQDEYGSKDQHLGEGFIPTDEGRDLVCLSINRECGLQELKAAFDDVLKELGITQKSGTSKTKDAQKSLRSLAIYRASFFSNKDYMRYFFAGTPYAGEKKDQKRRLQEIKKKLEEIQAR